MRQSQTTLLLATAAVLALGCLPAAATPTCSGITCTLLFTGTGGYGISQADAGFLAGEGFDLVTPDRVELLGVDLGIFNVPNETATVSPFPPTATGPHVATEQYEVGNVSGGDLIGDNYFLVTQILKDFEYLGEPVVYPDTTDISLTITADPWVIVEMDLGAAGSYFYPAFSLGALGTGEIADSFDVILTVNGPIPEIVTADNSYRAHVLPMLRHGSAFSERTFSPTPEPGAATLFLVGLLVVRNAARRRPR